MRSRIRNAVSDTIFLLRSVPSPVVTVFTLSVVLMNILANKTIYQHGILAVDGGFVLSWAVFLCMDIITKHFGPRAATKISVCALIVNLFVSGIFALVAAIPTEADFSAFNTVIGGVWFILFSSSAAFIVSAFVNNGMNYAIGRLFSKDPDGRAAYFTRSYVSTFVGQFVDNFIFAGLTLVEDSSKSILAVIAGYIAPVFGPLGFGDWRFSTALISGFMAKESVVSTLNVLVGSGDAILPLLTPVSAMALLVFSLLYTPCVAAVASVKRELGAKWAASIVIFQCVIAWIAAFIVTLIGNLFI